MADVAQYALFFPAESLLVNKDPVVSVPCGKKIRSLIVYLGR